MRSLGKEVQQGIEANGIAEDPKGRGKLYAYECDGLGHYLFIDDAGIPGLTTIPYLNGTAADSPLNRNSRLFAQSAENPFFFQGTAAKGTGSPHIPGPNIWPMGIIGRAVTSTNDQEIRSCLAMLERSNAGTGFMHESFNKDDPRIFTRSWFAWVNNLFGELIIKIYHERPELLKADPS